MKPHVGIIGYGRFGRLAAHYLKRKCRVTVADERPIRQLEHGVRKSEIATVATLPYVLLAVPINRLPDILCTIAPLVRPGALIIDVASVKEKPMRWMREFLPKTVSFMGSHPLFGPESAPRSVLGKTIILCPGRIAPATLRLLHTLFRRSGLVVVKLTPQEHDKRMASTLFLAQFVGRALAPLHLSNITATTENYSFLKLLSERTSQDTSELFLDMYRYNRYATRIPVRVLRSVLDLTSSIGLRKRSRPRALR